MPDIIQVLPDNVANQIAAGEVIQRPASVIKELVENAIDAGCTAVKVIIADSGKTLVQVIDNGKGMSETDARMSFERHATSKIRSADDLFKIRTMGFRGEALASIAAIAYVELKTRQQGAELGTYIEIVGAKVVKQDSTICPVGCNFSIKNLFFNVPARRKFLKADATEFKHIVTEFQRVALAYPTVEMLLMHNDTEIYNLPSSNYHKRIVGVFGKTINQSLLPIEVQTQLVKIFGYVGKPEYSRKTYGEQYLFVNQRFIRHPQFHKAVTMAYEKILPPDAVPTYFLYFDINPEFIDVNIHPTKTEINFEDSKTVFQILYSSVKEALGKFNMVPSLDFNMEGKIDIPTFSRNTQAEKPTVIVDEKYNPFTEEKPRNTERKQAEILERQNMQNWGKLYDVFEKKNSDEPETQTFTQMEPATVSADKYFQWKNKFILTSVKSGLMLVDQRRAMERIHFDMYFNAMLQHAPISQTALFPKILELNIPDSQIFAELLPSLSEIGFGIEQKAVNQFAINRIPSLFVNDEINPLLIQFLQFYKQNDDGSQDMKMAYKERVALALSKSSNFVPNKPLNQFEMSQLIDTLFACPNHSYTPDGKPIIKIINTEEIEKMF